MAEDQHARIEESPSDIGTSANSASLTIKQKLVSTVAHLTPDRIQKVAKVWGGAVFVGFILGIVAGFLTAIALYRGAWVPSTWIAKEYRQETMEPNSQPSPTVSLEQPLQKNPTITYSVVEDAEEPMHTLWNLLNGISKEQKAAGIIKASSIGIISSPPMNRAESIKWTLQTTSGDYKILGYAVRQSRQGKSLVYEPMTATQDREQSYITFELTSCEEGDVLFATLMTTSRTDINVSFERTFQSGSADRR